MEIKSSKESRHRIRDSRKEITVGVLQNRLSDPSNISKVDEALQIAIAVVENDDDFLANIVEEDER